MGTVEFEGNDCWLKSTVGVASGLSWSSESLSVCSIDFSFSLTVWSGFERWGLILRLVVRV